MGASFRTVEQIVHLAGCDLLTISPSLLARLENTSGEVTRHLSTESARALNIPEVQLNEKNFAGCTTKMQWRWKS